MAWCSKSQHLTEILMNYINHWIMIAKVNRILNLQLAQPPPISALRKPQGAPASARPSHPAAAHPTTEPAGWSNMPGSSKPWGWGQNWDQQWKMVILKLTVILYNCIILLMILSSDISLDDGIMQLFVIIWAMILSSNSWWVLRSTTWGQNGSKRPQALKPPIHKKVEVSSFWGGHVAAAESEWWSLQDSLPSTCPGFHDS